ncbi:mitochondrial inner membrane translocase [Chloropicon primus]|uniref:Mitochondrial import inner membrane translocase subunit n=1 Tax=Chloropicon primus TaxID=1764295 RepID=A0A5B8MTS0_9CHLO|nr:mitochondrial inner membrane translocase [Chloropicon primus]UPR02929.1 mitochondrial inner membrane translocase [Chloropicon primus]|eukprot:QDZ23716.1 mitochondrial inner membrane translocase [Chloropicon primus]
MNPADLEGLPEEDKQKMVAMIDNMQMKDSLRMYNRLVEKCFNNCVSSFRRKNLDSEEERCVTKCCEKFLKHSARVSVRFAELNAGAEAMMQQQVLQQQQQR